MRTDAFFPIIAALFCAVGMGYIVFPRVVLRLYVPFNRLFGVKFPEFALSTAWVRMSGLLIIGWTLAMIMLWRGRR